MAGGSFSHIPVNVDIVSSRYRSIKTAIPVPESIPLLEKMFRLRLLYLFQKVFLF